jgi:hypothetical protein
MYHAIKVCRWHGGKSHIRNLCSSDHIRIPAILLPRKERYWIGGWVRWSRSWQVTMKTKIPGLFENRTAPAQSVSSHFTDSTVPCHLFAVNLYRHFCVKAVTFALYSGVPGSESRSPNMKCDWGFVWFFRVPSWTFYYNRLRPLPFMLYTSLPTTLRYINHEFGKSSLK